MDSILILLGFACLVALWVCTGSPLFEQFGHGRLTYLTVLALPMLMGIATLRRREHRVSRALRDWCQVVAVLLVYECLKHLHANHITEWLGIQPKDEWALRVDELLFGGKTLALWLQPLAVSWFTQVMWFFYVWVYYLGPVVVLGWAYFWLEDDELFFCIRRGIVVCLLGGYVCYLLVPVGGPLFTVGDQFEHPILTQPTLHRLVFNTLRYNWDCFPSLHTALSWLLVGLAWKRMGRTGRVVAAVAATGVTLSTLVLRFHYGIDLIAGVIWAVLVGLAVTRVPVLRRSFRIPLLDTFDLAPTGRTACVVWFGALFAASGAAGMILELAHDSLMRAWVGRSVRPSLLWLAVYFFGLAAGAVAYDRIFGKTRRSIRAYALLEGGAALWALLLASFGHELVVSFINGFVTGPLPFDPILVGVIVGSAWLLVPAILIGATIPAVAGVLRDCGVENVKQIVSKYWIGAVVGALSMMALGPAWVLRYGFGRALVLAFAIDVVAATLGLQIGLRLTRSERAPAS